MKNHIDTFTCGGNHVPIPNVAQDLFHSQGIQARIEATGEAAYPGALFQHHPNNGAAQKTAAAGNQNGFDRVIHLDDLGIDALSFSSRASTRSTAAMKRSRTFRANGLYRCISVKSSQVSWVTVSRVYSNRLYPSVSISSGLAPYSDRDRPMKWVKARVAAI